jgi:hypothetical protein
MLKSGDLKLLYQQGAIRRIMFGKTEVLRMVFSAVRDRNWGTVEGKIISEKIEQKEGAFLVNLKVEYQEGEIHFISNYKIEGKNNRVRFEMDGEALSSFHKNRIGFCVLHPIEGCAGKSCRIIHSNGSESEAVFPRQISPTQPMMDIRSMKWQAVEGLEAEINFEGDTFEMEDQRNWTDASYKTYCTPLGEPFPVWIEKGTEIKQAVEFIIKAEDQAKVKEESGNFTFSWDESRVFPLPDLGTCQSSRDQGFARNEIEILKALPFTHYRAELKLFDKNWETFLKQAANESQQLGWPLFLVLYLSSEVEAELKKFISGLKKYKANLKYCFAVRENHLPDVLLTDKLIKSLQPNFSKVIVGTGVNAYFAELNRNRPQNQQARFVNFTISPQVHAFDDLSLVENLEAQADVVKSAKNLFPGKEVFVSPITLKQRFNVVATSEEEGSLWKELPFQVDARQLSPFAAAWMLGSLKNLAEAGATLVTFFETVGWRGIVQGNFAPSMPEKFPAEPGELFPVFHLLNEFSGFREMFLSERSSPLNFTGMVLKNGKTRKILLANFSGLPISVLIKNPLDGFLKHSLGQGGVEKVTGNQIILQPNEIISMEGLVG